ncbi:MAG: DHH family phosphoesterase [Clostridia bacterium]|nr:DHH family phosphoesterase [Clostridia bacterium]
MKKKNRQMFPYIALFSCAMLICALVSLWFSETLFIIEGIIALVSIVVSLVIYLRYNHYMRAIVNSVVSSTRGIDKKYLDRFGFPVAIAGKDNELVWYNDAFSRAFCDDKNMYGESVTSLIHGRSLAELCGSKGADIEVGKAKYSVYANPVEQGFVLYFFDDTYYKDIEKEFEATRQSVALVVLDNREAFDDEDEDETAHITVQVESLLQKWAAEYNALYRKWGTSRYMLVFEEQEIKKLISNKFQILSKVREIRLGDVGATISVGIGRGENNLRKSQASAKRALDMALGRGGDQVAILSNGEFEFFGGKSAGIERQSKVRVRVIAKSLVSAVEDSDKVIVMGHKFSDLDCVGSAVGLYGAITRSLHKKVLIAVDYPTSMAKSLIDAYKTQCGEGVFISPKEAMQSVTDKTLLIIVDTQSVNRIESPELYHACNRVIVIDHHRMSVDHLENTLVFYHEPSASSASEMCVEIIDSLPDDVLKKPEAEALLSGIILDTKNFVVNSGSRTFEAAAYLRKRGADTVSVRQLFSDSIEIYRNKYKLVSTARIYKKCAIVIADEEMQEIRLIASKAADELLGLKGVNASFVIFRADENTVNISARSYGKRNVQLIMEKLGGGGHHAMAAAQISDVSFETAVKQLIEAIDSE